MIITGMALPRRTFLRGVGAPPPPPPADVPPLPEGRNGGRILALRERMEEHRRNPGCATCHAPMDPLGFVLENFDPTGRWRTNEGFTPWSDALTTIDASAVLPDGTRFDGPAGLRAYLLGRSEEIVGSVARNLVTYALGRGLEYYDLPAVRKIVKDSARSNYSASSLIVGIVKSTPFRMRNPQVEPAAAAGLSLCPKPMPSLREHLDSSSLVCWT